MKYCIGDEIHRLAAKLFPICRSITGNGVRETLQILSEVCNIQRYEIPTGTEAFDWVVPKEWNINEAWIKDENNNTIIDFKNNNLHVMGYSTPIDQIMSGKDLEAHIYSLPEMPDVIPYITSYYKERWGFCTTDKVKKEIASSDRCFHVYIDSELKNGNMTYGEILLPGESEEEVLISTYVCHPSMANNELSGPCVAIFLADWINQMPNRKYSYRIIFAPETIGSIVYLSKNSDCMKKNTIAGFVLTCIGREDNFSYIPSRYGNSLADKVVLNVLKYSNPTFNRYTFLDRGADERQFCSPGVDLPVCSVTKTKYAEYPEYHTSADNMELITPKALQESFEFYKECIEVIESNFIPLIKCKCEPQLGKRDLYPSESTIESFDAVKVLLNVIAYADGSNDLIDISNIIGVPARVVSEIINKLIRSNLID